MFLDPGGDAVVVQGQRLGIKHDLVAQFFDLVTQVNVLAIHKIVFVPLFRFLKHLAAHEKESPPDRVYLVLLAQVAV